MAYSSKKWDRIISSWEKSGLTQREFCHQNNLPLSTFHYWRRKHQTNTNQKTELIKVETKNILSTESSFVLDFSGGVKLTVPSNYHPEHLKRLLSDLRDVL